ncbi:alpha/beta fold hydrolase [Colwellia sp. 6M3]|jgi:pimeloyl-ACP methyl ester carboxylesterase|uniref:alpha/beta fold hydrolase n=1 Tax=Colwellia sp. 6M3 TaxID=2759849 RepID=UPI0015F3B702|nr:alpha/beta fold hydrolase [Colwellia sp. 6M3]MBA6417022.1 alpha/beta fold hydrolase [Colwellia sp. 6M3]
MQQESIYITEGEEQLHLRHIWQRKGGVPIFMLHGLIENGFIFYTEKGKGLACYLAEQGFDVYVADLRGRGKSLPAINSQSTFGQHETITCDIALFLEKIQSINPQKMHLIAHSWGGVLISSFLARYPKWLDKLHSKTCFGTKRVVTAKTMEAYFKLGFMWRYIAPILAKKNGYFDAKKFRFGSDSETKKSLEESITWVIPGKWHDLNDGFDYYTAAQNITWPPTWHLTGISDYALGHQQDVQLFIDECNNRNAKFSVLSKQAGNQVNYDHINILTHPNTVNDHFPKLALWLKGFS